METMSNELPKCYRSQYLMDKNYLSYRKEVWEKFANRKVKIVPSLNNYNSFKELEKYDGHIGTVHNINFTCNGRSAYIYITGCSLPLSEKFLEIIDE